MEWANTLAYYYTATITTVKKFYGAAPGPDVIKLFFNLHIFVKS
jgi:hypothetical protein